MGQRSYGEMTPERIKGLRLAMGLGQKELGKLMDVRTETVNRWERGRCVPIPSLRKLLVKLAEGMVVVAQPEAALRVAR